MPTTHGGCPHGDLKKHLVVFAGEITPRGYSVTPLAGGGTRGSPWGSPGVPPWGVPWGVLGGPPGLPGGWGVMTCHDSFGPPSCGICASTTLNMPIHLSRWPLPDPLLLQDATRLRGDPPGGSSRRILPGDPLGGSRGEGAGGFLGGIPLGGSWGRPRGDPLG